MSLRKFISSPETYYSPTKEELEKHRETAKFMEELGTFATTRAVSLEQADRSEPTQEVEAEAVAAVDEQEQRTFAFRDTKYITVPSVRTHSSGLIRAENQDAVIFNSGGSGVYAVIDGGHYSDGGGAVFAAQNDASSYIGDRRREGVQPNNLDEVKAELIGMYSYIKDSVSEEPGDAVGTFITTHEIEGKKHLGVLHAGSTRMFIRSANGEIRSITANQSTGGRAHNTLSRMDVDASDERLRPEILTVEVSDGDRIMLCSDGITGSEDGQFLSEAEMRQGFSAATAEESAETFYEISKSSDDKTAIVLDV